MTPQQITYAKEIHRRIMGVAAWATAVGIARGRDGDGMRIHGLEGRLNQIPIQLAEIASWAKENKPE